MLYFPPWRIVLIGLALALGVYFAAPNIAPAPWRGGLLPDQTLNLGLDLQGGSHLLLEVDVDAVREERVEALADDMRRTLREARIGYQGGIRKVEGGAEARLTDPNDLSEALRLVRELSQPVASSGLGGAGGLNPLGGGGGAIGGGQSLDVREISPGVVRATITSEQIDAIRVQTVAQSIEIIRRRIDELGTREPTIQRQGEDRVIVQVPGESDPARIKDVIGRTAAMSFHLLDESASVEEAQRLGRTPPGTELVPSADGYTGAYIIRSRALLSGDNLVNAQPAFDENGAPAVSFTFDSAGTRIFGRVTSENIGRRFAIVLDDEVITAPVIQTAILSPTGQITGSFSIQEANDLAVLLRAGALPAPLTVLEERTVGAELGADSIAAGSIALIIGFSAVIVFMLAAYGLFGVFATTALIANVVLIAAALSGLQATLTLPGIAGIILTIGMAVDANVLIFERIREEVRAGRTPVNAVEAGYKRAWGTIVDANLTTLIAAAILFQFGSGPVKGFAVTLAIGILTSLFTAFELSRLMVSTWLRRARPKALPIVEGA
ncbi:MAG: protein translocase subunit SecD [Maricaulaceae bacterium]